MSRLLDRVLRWWHTAPGAPRLVAGDQLPWRRVLPVAVLGALLAALVVGQRAGLPGELDPTAPFDVGYTFSIREALAERGISVAPSNRPNGYDGQWFLGQATDPLLLGGIETTFDAPRYRAMRVLLPALGWMLGAGQPAVIPYALLVVQLLAVALGCAASARIVTAYRRSPWWGVAFAAIPGVGVGVAYGTAEPLALALAAFGLSLMMDRRYEWAGLAFAGGALTKETYLAFALGGAVYLAIDSRDTRPWLRPVAAVLLPSAAGLAAWWAYVRLTVPPDQAHGVVERFSPPLVGWLQMFGSMVRGEYAHDYPFNGASEAILIGSFAILLAAIGFALWLRQTLLAYLALGWSMFGLIIAGFLLDRFVSAQRALAPAIFVAGAFLITVYAARRDGQEGAGPEAAYEGRQRGVAQRRGAVTGDRPR